MPKPLILTCLCIIFSSFSQSHSIRKVEAEKIYVSTDRYYYNPGETVYFSAFVSNAESQSIQSGKVKVWLENNRNQKLDSTFLLTAQSGIEGRFKLPSVGGIYYLKSITAHQMNFVKNPVFTKEIFVQSYVKQNVNVRINLDKKNYKSKDSVKGEIILTESGNKPITQTPVTYNLVKNGEVVQTQEVKSDIYGKVSIKMLLPLIEDSSKARFYLTASISYRASNYAASERILTKKRKAIAHLHYAHGNTGYIVGEKNRVILKTTDKYANPMDIDAILVNSDNSQKIAFTSLKNGLGSFEFTPHRQTQYYLVRDKDTLLELAQAKIPKGLLCTQKDGKFTASILGANSYANITWTVTHNGEVLTNGIAPQYGEYAINTKGMTGVLSVQIADFGEPIAQKVIFLGREQMKTAEIDLKDSIFMKGKLKEFDVKHPEGKKAQFSVAIIEESNINQIEDKSHNVVSWLYLGSEFKKEIHEPQFYFDDQKPLSSESLELLMHTLGPYWIRDFNSGKVIGNPNFEFVSTLNFGGNVRNSTSYDWTNCDQVSVSLKNTSIQTFTDSVGNFELAVPAYYQGEATLLIKKGLEKMEYVIGDLNQVINRSEGFYEMKEIAQPKLDSVLPLFVANEQEGGIFLDHTDKGKELVAKFVAGKKDLAGFKNNALLFGGSRAENSINALDGVAVRGVANISLDNAYNLSAPALMGDAYLWDFNGDIINTWSFGVDGKAYQNPYYVSVKRHYYRKQPQPETNGSTSFWKSFIETNLKGKAAIKLGRQLAAGGFLILIEGIDELGKPFWAKKYIEVKDRFAVEANIPEHLYVGDQALVNVSLTNNQKKSSLVLVHTTINQQKTTDSVYLNAKETRLHPINLGGLNQIGTMPVQIQVQSGEFSWYTSKNVQIENYHIQETEVIGGDSTNSKTVDLSNAERSSITMKMEIFPSLGKQIMEIAQNLIRQPGGCFEQVSSSNYPNIMALTLIQQGQMKDRSIQQKARKYIQMGYDKLVSYETPQSGFEWFGNNPPHEALTAYGLLQFHLMKKTGLQIDETMFKRNLNWLWGRRDNQGGFQFTKAAYDRFSRGNYAVNNAYITYVLARVSNKDITPQINALEQDVKKNFDGYKMALLINILQKKGQMSLADAHYQKLKKHITKSVFKEIDTKQSIVCNRGTPLDLEVIAITLMAAVHAKDLAFAAQLRTTILKNTNSRGYFGSTQATALSLEALTLLAAKESAAEQSVYNVYINNQLIKTIDLSQNSNLKVDIPSNLIRESKNKIEVRTTGKVKAYNFTLNWVEKRTSKINKRLPFEVSYSKDSMKLADFCEMKVYVKNRTKIELGQVVATLNIPSALGVSTEELRQLTRLHEISYYELIGNKLNLYFLGFDPGQERTVSLNLRANLPGTYHSASHEVFEYYQPEVVSKYVSNTVVIQ